MPTYSYRCKTCGHEFDRTTAADAVKCEQFEGPENNRTQCPGWARRLWVVNIAIQNLKREREGR